MSKEGLIIDIRAPGWEADSSRVLSWVEEGTISVKETRTEMIIVKMEVYNELDMLQFS